MDHEEFIRERADKVLAFLLDHCATSFYDQREILELALADTKQRINEKVLRDYNTKPRG